MTKKELLSLLQSVPDEAGIWIGVRWSGGLQMLRIKNLAPYVVKPTGDPEIVGIFTEQLDESREVDE
jgi:hypothetical protein